MFNEHGEFVWYDDDGNEGVMRLSGNDSHTVSLVLREDDLETVVALHYIRDAKTLRALAGAAIHFAQRIDPLPGTRPGPVSGPDRLT